MPFSAASCDQQQQHIQILLFHTFSFYFVGYDIFYFVNLYYCSWRKQNFFFFFNFLWSSLTGENCCLLLLNIYLFLCICLQRVNQLVKKKVSRFPFRTFLLKRGPKKRKGLSFQVTKTRKFRLSRVSSNFKTKIA